MATRPWVTPDNIREYTDNKKVKARSDAKLKMDIARAELYVISYTSNRFDDATKYPNAPEAVVMAVTLLAEMYAGSSAETDKGNFKSETFDDYSYTLADTAKKQENLDLGPLLDEFVDPATKAGNGVDMRLRKL